MIFKVFFYLELVIFYKVFENEKFNMVDLASDIFDIIYLELKKISIQSISTFIKEIHSHKRQASLNWMNSYYYRSYVAFTSNLDLLMIICYQLKIF
jgi:hypothetical protein